MNLDKFKGQFEADGYNLDTVKETLEGKRREVDEKLLELEGDLTLQYQYLKGLFEEEQKQEQSLLETVKKKATEVKDETTEKAKSTVIEKGKKVLEESGFGDTVEKVTSFTEGITGFMDKLKSVGKYIGVALAPILGFLGIKNLPSWLGGGEEKKEAESNSVVASKQNNQSEQAFQKTPNQSNGDIPKKTANSVRETDETLQIKENIRYNLGFSLLRGLSGKKLDKSQGVGDIRKNLGKKTYEDFLKNRSDKTFINKISGSNSEKQYSIISEAYASQKVQDLLRIGLKPEMLNIILKGRDGNKENEKLKNDKNFRFEEILKMSNSGDFKYEKLTIYELTTLYTYTIPAFSSGLLSEAFTGLKTGLGSMFGGVDTSEFKELQNNFLDEKMLSQIITTSISSNKSDAIKETEDGARQIFKITKEQETDFHTLFEFKEFVLNTLLDSKNLKIDDETRKKIEKRIDYKGIIALYEVMGGSKDIATINPVNIPIIGFVLSKVISSPGGAMDHLDASSYLVGLGKETLFPDNSDPIFTDDEKRVMGIYKDSFIDLYISNRLNNIMGVAGLFTDRESMGKTAIAAGVGGLGLKIVADKRIKKAIEAGKLPFFSRYLKILGWGGMIGGAALGGLSMVAGPNEDLGGDFKELENAYKNKDLKKIKEFLDEFEESVENYKKGEDEVKVISYNKEAPYLIYKGTVYQIGLMSDNLLGNTTGGLVNIDNQGKKIIVENGKIKVTIDNNSYDFNIETVVNASWKSEEIANEDSGFWNKIIVLGTDILRDMNTGLRLLDGGRREKVFNLGNIGDFSLYLLPVGDLPVEGLPDKK